MSVAYLDLADFLAIAELVLQEPGEDIAWVARLDLAESALHAPAASFSGVEFYPDLAVGDQRKSRFVISESRGAGFGFLVGS